jgi:hypothetical protein
MTAALHQLISIASEPLAPPLRSMQDVAGRTSEQLIGLLANRNGFFCFEGALRVFPSITSDASWGVFDWNSPGLWKCEYGGLADSSFCFAEDAFANQFVVDLEGAVSTFNPETGEVEKLASSIEEWANQILENFDQLTGYSLAHAWQQMYGRLLPRFRLMPKQPFVLRGEYTVANLVAVDGVRVMRNLGNLARQIHDLPDGAKIQFRVSE